MMDLVLNRTNGKKYTEEEIEYKISHHDDQILYNVAIALKMGISVETNLQTIYN